MIPRIQEEARDMDRKLFDELGFEQVRKAADLFERDMNAQAAEYLKRAINYINKENPAQ